MGAFETVKGSRKAEWSHWRVYLFVVGPLIRTHLLLPHCGACDVIMERWDVQAASAGRTVELKVDAAGLPLLPNARTYVGGFVPASMSRGGKGANPVSVKTRPSFCSRPTFCQGLSGFVWREMIN